MEKLNVKAASRLSGVSEHTLRAWERRYQAISPSRTEASHRLYTMEDVERLRLLSTLVQEGYSIGVIARLHAEELRVLLKKSGHPSEPKKRENFIIHDDPAESDYLYRIHREEILRTISDFRIDLMDQALTRARAAMSAHSFVLEIASAVVAEVGRQVDCGDWTIVQEHAFSAVLRDHLGQVLRNVTTFPQGNSRSVALATPEGDHHEFGILIAAILFAIYKYRTFYLGPNLPAQELAKAAKRLHTEILVIGTTPTDKPANSYLLKLDKALPKDFELWVGGSGIDLTRPIMLKRKWIHLQSLKALDLQLRDPTHCLEP